MFQAAKQGDALAEELVDDFCHTLAVGMADIANVIDPEAFVLGGGVSKAGEMLRGRVEEYYRKLAFHVCEGTTITLATLGSDAGIYGAAGLLLNL